MGVGERVSRKSVTEIDPSLAPFLQASLFNVLSWNDGELGTERKWNVSYKTSRNGINVKKVNGSNEGA